MESRLMVSFIMMCCASVITAQDEGACTKYGIGMEWSYAGPIPSKHCVQISEPEDCDGWSDNFRCFNQETGVQWSSSGSIDGMTCTLVNEPYESEWSDNYICVPPASTFAFEFSYSGPIENACCVQVNEPGDSFGWEDNYMCLKDSDPCTKYDIGMEWSYAGPIPSKHCVQISEPEDPDGWSDNYLCFNQETGVQWCTLNKKIVH